MRTEKTSGRPRTVDGTKIPLSLKLEFSKAADAERLDRLFAPSLKKKVDPHNFVVRRDGDVLAHTITNGGAAFLSGKKGAVYAVTISYPMREDKNSADNTADYKEVGTTMARMGGYSSAKLVISALALKEWWSQPPRNMIMAEIDPDNAPSLHAFTALGWQPINDKDTEDRLFRLCNETIAPEDQGNLTVWLNGSHQTALTTMAKTVLAYMDQGGLVNKRTGHKVAVDFNALSDAGLTRKRLEAMASGNTKRKSLLALG